MTLAIAFLPSLLFGVMALTIGAFPADARRQNVAVMAGAGIVSLAVTPFLGGDWSLKATLLGILSGLMWSTGQVLVLRGFHSWGVSRTMPLTTALQLALNAAIGVALLGEWRAPGALPLGLLALALIMAGALGCSWQEHDGPGPSSAARRAGLIATVLSALVYGSYAGMLRLADVSSADALGPMGIGLLLGSLACVRVIPSHEPVVGPRFWPSAVAGGIWAVGNAILLHSTTTVGVATGFSLSQLGFVISATGGVLLLGEQRSRREGRATAAGVVAAVIGVVLLGLAAAR
ncbi:GRP family sugar transporter [Actinomyces radicidentis]|nr:GRP family sugar transporter [Actinomyces radicidentis]